MDEREAINLLQEALVSISWDCGCCSQDPEKVLKKIKSFLLQMNEPLPDEMNPRHRNLTG